MAVLVCVGVMFVLFPGNFCNCSLLVLTSDIKNRIMNPVTDHQVVPGKNSGTEEPTGANIMTGTKVITCEPNGTKNVLSDQTGTQVTRSHISNEVSVKISDHHKPLTIQTIHFTTISNDN